MGSPYSSYWRSPRLLESHSFNSSALFVKKVEASRIRNFLRASYIRGFYLYLAFKAFWDNEANIGVSLYPLMPVLERSHGSVQNRRTHRLSRFCTNSNRKYLQFWTWGCILNNHYRIWVGFPVTKTWPECELPSFEKIYKNIIEIFLHPLKKIFKRKNSKQHCWNIIITIPNNKSTLSLLQRSIETALYKLNDSMISFYHPQSIPTK